MHVRGSKRFALQQPLDLRFFGSQFLDHGRPDTRLLVIPDHGSPVQCFVIVYSALYLYSVPIWLRSQALDSQNRLSRLLSYLYRRFNATSKTVRDGPEGDRTTFCNPAGLEIALCYSPL
jgi:hypothetical protein